MTRTFSLLALACLVLTPAPAFARARFMPRAELIAESPLIALVEVTSVAAVTTKGRHWTYGQAAQVTLERGIRGDLPATFVIHAEKNFICARASYAPGRYLVFLRREGPLYTTVNHHLGCYPVLKDRLRFLREGETYPSQDQALDKVLKVVSDPAGYFPLDIRADARVYARESVRELSFPGQERVLGKHRFVSGDYAFRPPSTGKGRATFSHRRLLLVEPSGVQRPQGNPQETLRAMFLAQSITATSETERAWVAQAFLYLLQAGRERFGTWWGATNTEDQKVAKGHVHEVRWTHGRSFSWTDVYRFRYDAEGKLLALDHEAVQH